MEQMMPKKQDERKDTPPVNPLEPKRPDVPGVDELLDDIDDLVKNAEKKNLQKRDEKKGQ